MKTIATLASEETVSSKKRKKGSDKDDGFGRDDSDWAVYREVVCYIPVKAAIRRGATLTSQGGEDDSDAEEEEQTLLQNIEERLLQFDPKFTELETLEGRAQARNALINAFVRGGSGAKFNPDDTRASHQIHLNVERIRVPETWFQPSMFGLDSAGLGELAGWVLNGYEEEQRRRMMQVSALLFSSPVLAHDDRVLIYSIVYLRDRRIIIYR